MKLMEHQIEALKNTAKFNRCAYYYDMGLGKTFIGAEKMMKLGSWMNLVICQKSKISDWIEHFQTNYDVYIYNLTDNGQMKEFLTNSQLYSGSKSEEWKPTVGVINYDLVFRRAELSKLKNFTLLLDESSLIQNETAKRSKFILNKLNPVNVILLSGTPVSGKYEALWSQCHLLGWPISKKLFYRHYVEYTLSEDGYPVISGYKNVDRLKSKLREYGAVFKKTEEVINLPLQTFIPIKVKETKDYLKFKKDRIIEVEGETLVGDTTLTNLLYQRQLCGIYSEPKLEALRDILESTNDRIIVFYNFTKELYKIEDLCRELDRPVSIVNGEEKDLMFYEEAENSVTIVQYQAGAYGLNLQKANRIVYFTPPLSTELFEQSKKRIHRIGQDSPCWYYELRSGIDYRIYRTLDQKKDYTDALFEEEENADI